VQDIIAERRLLFGPKGTDSRRPLAIRLARPFWSPMGSAVCQVTFDGLSDCDMDVHGSDFLQAVQLASNVDPILKSLSRKYDFYFETGEAYFDAEDLPGVDGAGDT
jgi:hypothetical protein